MPGVSAIKADKKRRPGGGGNRSLFRQGRIFSVISKPDWDPLKQEDSSSEGNNLHFYRSRKGRTERRGKGKLWHLLLGWIKLPHPFKGLD